MAELKVEKHWVEGGHLFVKVSSEDREKLVNGIREFVSQYVNKTETQLSGWIGAGVEKAECPQAYDPENPDTETMEAAKQASAKGRQVKWVYSQIVRLTKGI